MTKENRFLENAGHKSVFLVLAAFVCAAFGAAPTNEKGEYTYAGTPSDMRTTGQTGDQTWTLAKPVTIGSFYPGQTDIVPYWQIYTGATITATGNDRIMKGNVVFENALVWSGTENYIGYTGPVKLMLRNGGSLTTTGREPIRIGRSYNNGTAGTATVFMEEPSTLACTNLFVGNQLSGALWMDGGIVALTNAALFVGDDSKTSDGGYIRLNGGEISLRAESNADAAWIGTNASYSSVHISGGKFATRRAGVPREVYFKMAAGQNEAADVYVDGGLLDLWNERVGLGYWDNGVTGARASLTVDGDGRVVAYLPVLGRTGSGNAVIVNLNGGRFELTRGLADYDNVGNARYLNFDGGTLALVKHAKTSGNVGELGTVAKVVVYPKGGSINVPSGITGNVSASFRAAEGYGVSEITLVDPGSGYVTAPRVAITGGVGSNATAYAVLNKDRTLEKIVVTCRGEGYAEGDAVTVTIESATGSGAAAVATLAPNAGGVIRKTGQGTLQQRTNDNAFGGEIEIVEGVLSMNGASVTDASALRMGEGTILRSVKGATSSLNRLDVGNGVVEIRGEGSAGTANLILGALAVSNGLALVTHTNGLSLALSSAASTATSSAASPVVNGLVYANKDASAYRSPLPFERAADGTLSPIATTTTPGPDANWRPAANIAVASAPELSAVNSIILPLTPAVECYVKNAGLVEVKSGMIVSQRPHGDGLQRMQVTGGGAFTTRAKDGMFIYADGYQTGRRSNSSANDNAVHFGNWRRLYGPFADPDVSTPMSLTVAGEKAARPELGAQAWLLGTQAFSGGLNLVNGGVFIQSDAGLGASGAPVRASGYCSIAAYNWTFVLSHPIELLDGSALIFSPVWGSQGNTVSGALSGTGDLLTSDVNRSGYAMEFTGDHSAFTGDYYIQGHARIAPATFSPLAGICLADGTNGVGVIETSGTFMRAAGTGKGEVCWRTHPAYANLGYGLRGGFAARGGNLTVNLGGAGAKLTVGADYLPDGTVIQLQSQYADGTLTFMNGFELGGKTQKVNVWTGKTATFAGALSDADGGGALAVTGNLALDGATLEIGAANLAAPMLAVDGALTLAGTLNLVLDVTKEVLSANGDVTLATATGGIGGTVVLSGNVPAGWTVLARANSLVLKKLGSTVITIK